VIFWLNCSITYRNNCSEIYNGEYTVNKPINIGDACPKFIYIEVKRNNLVYDNAARITRFYFFRISDNSYFGHMNYHEWGNITYTNTSNVSSSWSNYFTYKDGSITIKYNPAEGGLTGTDYSKVQIYS